jgi:hypothetical protein
MTTRRRPASADTARLKVLASTDERAFAELALDMLRSPQRLQREAALEALAEHPVDAVRDTIRALYLELDADGTRLDQGARLRVGMMRYLLQKGDPRDADIAVLASERYESLLNDDVTYELRTLGLRLLAKVNEPLLLYYVVEHLNDSNVHSGEPASTALQLLADTGNWVILYDWLRGAGLQSPHLIRVFEWFGDAPRPIMHRVVRNAVVGAIADRDERMCIALAEAIVNLELEDTYQQLDAMISAKISDDLYHYLAVLLASTNRTPLLDILRQQLRRGRRPKLVAEALRIRTTPEQAEILRKWEDGELDEEP